MKFNAVEWHVFSKHARHGYEHGNVKVFRPNKDGFVDSMASSSGVICGAGFETPSEALFLGKKLITIPMKNQYEQHFNAIALKEMGVTVLPSFNEHCYESISEWIQQKPIARMMFPNETEDIVKRVLDDHNIFTAEQEGNSIQVNPEQQLVVAYK